MWLLCCNLYMYILNSEWVSSGPWPQLSEDDWEGQIATHGSCGWLVGLVLVHYVELISKTVTFALIIVEMEPSCVNVCHSLCGVSVSVPEQQQQICNKTAGRGVRPRTSCTWWDPLIEKVTSFLAKILHALISSPQLTLAPCCEEIYVFTKTRPFIS